MPENIEEVRKPFIQTMGQISHFWGFSSVMGQIYGVLYLNENPTTMEDVMKELNISKGNVSMNLRNLERWGMIKKVWQGGGRKFFYEAESDFTKIFTDILQERRNKDFERMLKSVGECLEQVKAVKKGQKATFAKKRLEHMHRFFQFLDGIVFTVLKLARKGK